MEPVPVYITVTTSGCTLVMYGGGDLNDGFSVKSKSAFVTMITPVPVPLPLVSGTVVCISGKERKSITYNFNSNNKIFIYLIVSNINFLVSAGNVM